MTADDQYTFDDPKLKAAISRTWGTETAPAALRSRIESLLTQAAEGTGDVIHVAPSFWRRHQKALGLAAAAVVVLGVGVVAIQMSGSGDNRGDARQALAENAALPAITSDLTSLSVAAAPAVPADLGAKLVKSHNVCVRVHPDEHHLYTAAPKDDFKVIAERMGAELKYPVVATALGDDWTFRGASLCPVGGKRVAHMMYTRGDAHLSVYSLPASAAPDFPTSCESDVNGLPVAAFADGGAVYCVLASSRGGGSPVDLAQVRAMRDRVKSEVLAAANLDRVNLGALAATTPTRP